jgi:prevent-host-death family protein
MKQVRVADLKARLSEHLRYVRRGHTVTVLDRDTPIARIVPYDPLPPLKVREPAGKHKLSQIPLPRPIHVPVEVVALLREDRDKR